MARAIWKGNLQLGKQELAVKLYSAIEDRTVRFHLLHAKDRAPVEQHIVRKDTGEDVGRSDMRKAFALDRSTAVILEPEDLEKLVPPESRDIACSANAGVGSTPWKSTRRPACRRASAQARATAGLLGRRSMPSATVSNANDARITATKAWT